jgi:hypothetical protein
MLEAYVRQRQRASSAGGGVTGEWGGVRSQALSRLRPLREALNMLQEPPTCEREALNMLQEAPAQAADPPHLKQEEEARKSVEPLEPLEAGAQVLQGVTRRRD